MALITVILIYLIVKNRRRISINNSSVFLTLGIISHIIVISTFLQFGQKYLLVLIPIFPVFLGIVISRIYKKKRLLGLITLLTFMFTNAPYILSERLMHPSSVHSPLMVRSFMADYAKSLITPYYGPIEGLVWYFKARGIASATVYMDYEVESLKFYFPYFTFVDRKITPGQNHPNPELPHNVDELTQFYIPRESWGGLLRLGKCEKDLIKNQFIKHVVLPYRDIAWENLPDISYHKFTLDDSLHPLLIYEKKDDRDFSSCRELKYQQEPGLAN